MKRLKAARQLYNACLGEALRRHGLVRQSKAYQIAIKLPKTVAAANGKRKYNPERSAALKAANQAHNFSEYALHAYVTPIRQSWIGEHLDANTCQKVGTRAFNAAWQYHIGKKGRPRFKGINQFDSVEGKNNKTGIVLRDAVIVWTGLTLLLDYAEDDEVIGHGLKSPVKYVRILRRRIRDRWRWYAQLVNEGQPFVKPEKPLGTDRIGLDIGPSTVATVGASKAHLDVFCHELSDTRKAIGRTQRALSRSQRASNPECFEPDRWVKKDKHWKRKKGKAKNGLRQRNRSNTGRALQKRLTNQQRVMAAHRKSLHGQLIHKILALGTDIWTEALSYKAFQRRFGRSVQF
ncbi:MAG: hypothetical protein ACR2PS_02095, partial [Pseudomonadales bacterium]